MSTDITNNINNIILRIDIYIKTLHNKSMKNTVLCNNCGHFCNVDRSTHKGFCGQSDVIKVALASLHYGEEPIISGTNGSGTIFFSGCNLKCVFCQNYKISHEGFGKEISVSRLIEIMKELEQKGAHNINFVTPTPYIQNIVSALKIYKPKVPVIFNIGGYENPEIIKTLKGLVDIFLIDIKYFDDKLAIKYSSAPNYFDIATACLKEIRKMYPQDIIENGLLKQGVIVRHLVMPTHTNDSIKVLDYLIKNYPTTLVSIMGQFTPIYKCEKYPEINRQLKPIEYKRVVTYASRHNVNGFMQDLECATTDYIPDFDLSGV